MTFSLNDANVVNVAHPVILSAYIKNDLSTELQLLAFHAMHRDALPGGGPATGSDLSTSEVLS